jgi:hypothetical protein
MSESCSPANPVMSELLKPTFHRPLASYRYVDVDARRYRAVRGIGVCMCDCDNSPH